MKLTLDVHKITIVQTHGSDDVFLKVNIRDAVWPYKPNDLTFNFPAAHHCGPQFVREELFPDVETEKLEAIMEVIDVVAKRGPSVPFSNRT
jgi:hypothetical protein